MIIAIETILLCVALFLLCFAGTGTDDKNLKSYSAYPERVQKRIRETPEYQGRFRESGKAAVFASNFLLFAPVFFILGLFIRENSFWHNFLCLTILGQSLNLFDLLVIDLLWWRHTKRIRFTKIPEKEWYQSPQKHLRSFGRGVILYLLIALIDGYILTLF